MNNASDWIRLSLLPGLGLGGLWRLISHFKTPGAVLAASRKQLLGVEGVREKQIAALLSDRTMQLSVEDQLRRLEKIGATAICYDDPHYPEQLKHLIDPPPVLYAAGDPSILGKPSVAVVGSRAATAYGRRVAFSLGQRLVQHGFTVVSGLALGIDTESHRGALHGGGDTIAVLGCGIDVVYPRQNRTLYQKIAGSGLLLSEYPLGTRPDGFRFPARNRIIAALCRGVVVVEAAKKSGSLITAQIGLDIGREIFAVPGQVDSFKSEGAHWLLQQGAKLVQNVDDIVVELGDRRSSDTVETKSNAPGLVLDGDTQALLKLIEPYPQQRDNLLALSGLPPARLSELLLFLELEGLIELLPGDRLRKVTAGL